MKLGLKKLTTNLRVYLLKLLVKKRTYLFLVIGNLIADLMLIDGNCYSLYDALLKIDHFETVLRHAKFHLSSIFIILKHILIDLY